MKPRSVNELILSFKKRLTSLGSPLAKFSPYSNVYALFRSISSVLAEQDTRLNNSSKESFISTATGSNLDRKAADFALYRLAGSKASGSILVKANRTGRLLKGTILNLPSRSLQYKVLSDINLRPGEALGKVEAVSEGSEYNLIQGSKLYSVTFSDIDITVGYTRNAITGQAVGSISGGSLTETDSEFRSRILSNLRKKDRYLGTLSSLREEILKLPYVSKVFIANHKPVTGYFTVYVDNRDSKNLNYISLLIESIKPVGTLFLLKPLVLKPISIRVECPVERSTNNLKESISNVVVEYVEQLSMGNEFNISDLNHLLSQVNPKAKVVSPATNINPTDDSVISISSLTVLV